MRFIKTGLIFLLLSIVTDVQAQGLNSEKTITPKISSPNYPVTLPDFKSAIKKITPSLVRIRMFVLHKDPSMPEHYDIAGFGTGIIISSDGYILTNHHIIKGGSRPEALINGKKYLPLTIVGMDILKDLALVKAAPPLTIGALLPAKFEKNGKTAVGDFVIKAGFPDINTPEGVPTFSHGIVSNLRSFIKQFPSPYGTTDALLSPGDSGGPLFNLAGEVVGINSYVASGLGYFIPASIINGVLPKLRRGDVRTGWLGIMPAGCVSIRDAKKDDFLMQKLAEFFVVQDIAISPGLNEGIVVVLFHDKKPNGVKLLNVGDIITHIDNREPQDSMELIQWISEINPGSMVTLNIIRNRKPMILKIRVDEFKWEIPPATQSKKGHGLEGIIGTK